MRTSGRVWYRRDRRPVGNSARLWKRLDEDDPFLPPRPKRHARPEHKPVYAAGRFIRLDRVKVKKRVVTPQDRLIARLREEAKRTRERALASAKMDAGKAKSSPAAPQPAPAPAPPSRPVHATNPEERAAALRKRLADIEAGRKAKARAEGKAQPPSEQPAPPPLPKPKARPTRHTNAGRFRASASKHKRRGWGVVERSPFEQQQEEALAPAPEPAPEESPAPKRKRRTVRSAADIPDLPPAPSIGKIPAPPSGPPVPLPVHSTPPKPPSQKAPPRTAGPTGPLSMDDLFGAAAMEGRVRVGRPKRKKAEPEPEPEPPKSESPAPEPPEDD